MKHRFIQWFEKQIEKHPPQERSEEKKSAFTNEVMDRIKSAEKHEPAKIIRFPYQWPVGIAAAAAAVVVVAAMLIGSPSNNNQTVANVNPPSFSLEEASAENLILVFELLNENPVIDDKEYQELNIMTEWLNQIEKAS